jgi:deoxyribose-phosphate aldolase
MNLQYDKNYIASLIDHTLLKPTATKQDIVKLCEEAKKYGFFAVCVNPMYVSFCKSLLRDTNVKVCTVIGFPLGATTTAVKVFESKEAIDNGADEIDMVINVSALRSKDYNYVLEDISAVREVTKGKILKVIIETAYLNEEEKIKACELAKEAKADFVKTSTGFAPTGATVEDVSLMRKIVGLDMGVKASGGIRTIKDVLKMIKAGANRIGTSSSVEIIEGKEGSSKY